MKCRTCKADDLDGFLDLGLQPHCNAFLRDADLERPEPRWPLALAYCPHCHLVQLTHVVDPAVMFTNYVYVSGTTRTLTEHFRQTARDLVGRYQPQPGSLVVDIGSNDGTLLQGFKDVGMTVLGVDPATNVAASANERGIETWNEFFTEETARRIVEERGHASLATACGVFFHIDDMDDACRGVHALLGDDGVLQVQAIYLGSMLDQNSYDNVYHEHVSYYTMLSLSNLFPRFGLEAFDVEHSEIHGGSLLVHVAREGRRSVSSSVESLLAEERSKGWDTVEPYREFAGRVRANRDSLVRLVEERKSAGRRVAAYTAPAKGNTLLNYCDFGPDMIEFAAEKAPLKIGLYTPGTRIPVVDETEALADPPDDFLLLAWNFREELLEKNQAFRESGGHFIVPVPEPAVV